MVRAKDRRTRTLTLVVVLVALLTLLVRGIGFPSFGNPFGSETVDRSATPLLTSLQDLSRFQAATGTFQVVVDLETDVKRVPSLLAGERTLFIAQGSVDAYVDFSGLGNAAVQVSEDRRTVRITLPAAALSDPRVDPEASRVVSRQRGVLDRIGGIFSDNPTGERELYLNAQDKMRDAATSSDLTRRAQDNTKSMLSELLATLGYTDVQVTFAADPS